MLGVIHRTVLKIGPPRFQQFFKLVIGEQKRDTRFNRRRHDKQLIDPRGPRVSEQLRRPALGFVAIYNLLPQEFVDAPNVSQFQSLMQDALKSCASDNVDGWQDLFSPRVPLYLHLLR